MITEEVLCCLVDRFWGAAPIIGGTVVSVEDHPLDVCDVSSVESVIFIEKVPLFWVNVLDDITMEIIFPEIVQVENVLMEIGEMISVEVMEQVCL